MTRKSKRFFSILMTAMFTISLLVAMPLAGSAAEPPFQITEHPVGATYMRGDTAVPIKATFEYNAIASSGIDSNTPIKVQWYWSTTNSTADRSNGLGESIVPYDRQIKHSITHIPATDTVGVKYYYAVLSYAESVSIVTGEWTPEPREAVTNTARIEVIEKTTNNNEQEFQVKKVDENGNPLAGAVIQLIPDSSYTQSASVISHEKTTSSAVYVSFSVPDGYYILSEKHAPAGYNIADEKYYINITQNGVFLVDLATKNTRKYETVTFVNKKIPSLNKDDHFAFMQGYPGGTFMPDRNMTRAEAVVMFSRLLTESMNNANNYKNSYYPDVPSTAWYANEVGYMQSLGVLADYSRDRNFRPNDSVTRAEFATLAAHFDNLTLTNTNSFPDVANNHWAVKYINSAAAKGWIQGYPDNTFKPEAYITRAEIVTLVGRMLDRSADSTYLTTNKASLPRTYTDLSTTHWAYLAIMEASTGHDYSKDSTGEHWTRTYQ